VPDIPDIEAVVAALKKRLDDDLSAAIEAVNAEVTDGTLIEQPQQILDHIPPVELLLAFPTIGIGEGVGRWTDDLGWEATGQHELSIVCFVQADDQQTLVRRLRRMRRALLRTVMADRAWRDAAVPALGRAWGVMLRSVQPGPTLGEVVAEQVRSWASWVQIVVEARSDSEWP
jgi:hypothetical protein